ncbi:Inositol transporter 1 [Galdieria sulphuraria]|nr:Inositol transporter 1 [Galdieria sulphuraria]
MTFQMKSLMMKLGRLELQLKETKVSFFNSITLGNPKVFTWVLVAFASMGGLLSGLDQSLISGANLYMLADLHLDSGQVSLVDSLMPLGAVLGALILSPTNEALGRKLSIIVACLLYTLGAGLEAGAHSVGREVESYSVWKRIRGVSDIDARREFIVMRHLVEQEQEEKKRLRYPYLDFIRVPRCRRAIVYANIMVFLGQFTGVNAIMYYMSVLMSEVGFSSKQSVFMSLVGGGSLLLGTIPAILWMDRFGRRVAAITLLPGFFVGLLIIGFGYFIPLSNVHSAEGVYLTGLIIYMWFFVTG